MLAAAVQIGSSAWPEKIKPHPHIFIAFCLVGVLFIVIPIARELWGLALKWRKPPIADDRTPIWQAVQHVAILSTNESKGPGYLPISREVIRQFAADGKVKIWGKRHLGVRPNFASRFDTVWVLLPPEFWVDNRIQASASVEMENPNVPFTIPIKGDGTWNDSYADLLVSKNEIETLFPKRGKIPEGLYES
jgi:hypothetical protein